MKKNIILCICVVIVSQITFAQSWIWSKKVTQPNYYANNKGLLTDKTGNVFSYGSNSSSYYYYDPATDTTGSYLQCYSTSGVLLFSKQWKIPFHIQKMDYDGADYFYFSGKFFGTQTIDGITVASQGNADGVCGKMDLLGNIIWMKTFGGSGPDAANGICYNPTDSGIYVTGGIKDTLFFNNSLQSINQQSAIICQYAINGNLIRHKLFDFIPQRNNGYNDNWGVEIDNNKAGNIFVLMDRDGQRWSGDSINGPSEGRYVMKLNTNLDTLWSTFIISDGCYYGWSCSSLRVAANGDAYVARSCSSKYGGMAELLRLNGSTGKITWNLLNHDGYYADVFIDSNTVYLIGNEGANGCPCEASNGGYYVIKKIDENNNLIGETRISSANLINITKDLLGNIFVTGGFWVKSATIGPDTILADSTLFYNSYDNYSGKFLSKLSDINCAAPIISVSIPSVYGHYYSLCPGDTAALTVNPTAGSFIWSNGNTGLQTNVGSTSNYSLVNNQPNGCIAYSLPVSVIVNENINSHKICMITYNEVNHKNTVVVRQNNSNAYDIKQINLFKKEGTSIIPLSSTTYGNLEWGTVFTDSTSNPDSVSVEYYISTIDTCNTESNLSLMHKSIFLKVNTDSNNKKALTWNAYTGIPITGYRIWRGSFANALVLVDSVGSSQTTYTDQNSAAKNYFYRVETINQWPGCYVNQIAYRSSRSNIAKDNLVLDIAASSSTNSFDVYPNPTRGSFQIRYSSTEKNKLQVNVFNTKGEKVFEESVSQFNGEYNKSIDLSKQSNGVYFIEISANGKREMKKIVLD